ncbi:MAG TPA: response regulator transcription factor [Acidimicrobiia bacterium]|nr:response regulator transcription factor [Acidimicrobiia bacterium]
MNLSRPQPGRAGAVRIAIQDRQRLYREGVALVLGSEPDLQVVATAATAAELVAVTAECAVDLVVLELDVEEWDACRLVAALRKRHQGLAVVGLLPGDDDTLPARAYQAGVRSVFPRNAGMRAFLRTVRSLPSPARAGGGAGSHGGHGGHGGHSPGRVVRLDERRPLLSQREVQVLGEIGAGATTRLVAETMGISPKTVENHKQRIFSKLGVQNQAHAVAVAMRQGLLQPTGFGPTLLPSA